MKIVINHRIATCLTVSPFKRIERCFASARDSEFDKRCGATKCCWQRPRKKVVSRFLDLAEPHVDVDMRINAPRQDNQPLSRHDMLATECPWQRKSMNPSIGAY